MSDVPAYHEPVLINVVLEYLVTDAGAVYVDATVGGGGHAGGICRLLENTGRLICFDADEEALSHARRHLEQFARRTEFVHANFAQLRDELDARGVEGIGGILFDLGVSSHQLDEPARGFSFRSDAPLDMRMDRQRGKTASDVVNTMDEQTLANILWRYGEERRSRRIAKSMVAARPIESTGQLKRIVESVIAPKHSVKSLARVFQALRIEVNDELRSLEIALRACVELLRIGGRIVVLSYHSLEDRIVKEFFKTESATSVRSAHKYAPDKEIVPRVRLLTRKPIVASDEEVERNPRARSAKLRVAERI